MKYLVLEIPRFQDEILRCATPHSNKKAGETPMETICVSENHKGTARPWTQNETCSSVRIKGSSGTCGMVHHGWDDRADQPAACVKTTPYPHSVSRRLFSSGESPINLVLSCIAKNYFKSQAHREFTA